MIFGWLFLYTDQCFGCVFGNDAGLKTKPEMAIRKINGAAFGYCRNLLSALSEILIFAACIAFSADIWGRCTGGWKNIATGSRWRPDVFAAIFILMMIIMLLDNRVSIAENHPGESDRGIEKRLKILFFCDWYEIMIRHILIVAWRNICKYKASAGIAVVGLAMGLLCFVLCNFCARLFFSIDKVFPN